MNSRGRIGRPPGPHDDTLHKLLPTALRLFIDEGGSALTPTRLHAETGVARATIYRNWPNPTDLIEIMLDGATEEPPADTFTGTLADDLHRASELLHFRFEHRPIRPFFAAGLEYGRTSEQVATVADAFIGGLLSPFRQAITHAVTTGELTGDVDDLLSEVTGPLILDHVVLGRPLSPQQMRAAIDRFLTNHENDAG